MEDDTDNDSENMFDFWCCNSDKKKVATAVVATGIIGTTLVAKHYY